ncbi:MAG TPA: ABC transporter substrate-binding protein [Dehalococcoidia bacterium]|nr:ABC transporter substrate-binding protein [Dehalococcoidia bacterium]
MSIIPKLTVRMGVWIPGLPALFTVLIIACGGPAATETATTSPIQANQPTATVTIAEPTPTRSVGATAVATTAPQPTVPPEVLTTSRDSITVVTSGEPASLDIFHNFCSGNIDHLVCKELTVDSLTWIDGTSFEVVPLSPVESWEQLEPHRWRFKLREGVKFHNGEPWNAEAAKFGIDLNGDGKHGGGFSTTGFTKAEVVDDFTVDVVCLDGDQLDFPCPIFPRTALFIGFAAPEWWTNATEDERARQPIGFGPYRFLEWQSGVQITLESYEDYLPNEAFDSRAPLINNVTQVWRSEALVRASMVAAGEADWVDNIGFENASRVPQPIQAGTNEMYMLQADNIWHPELKKKDVRKALAHAIDCQEIVETLYEGKMECFGNISQPGTLGLNEENSRPYEYDPEMSRQLLEQAGYDPANEIRIHTREGRVYRDVELWEAVVNYWKEVGVNASMQVLDNATATAVRRSGCGSYEPELAARCWEQPAPPPTNASSHYFETSSSNEPLDYARQLTNRMSCFNVNSRWCDPEWEAKIDIAKATPLGPEREAILAEMAQTAHDEYWFIPFFHVQAVYGLAEDLEWTPRYDPRIRINTMRFR